MTIGDAQPAGPGIPSPPERRRAHLVGSLPAADPRQAMEQGLGILGERLVTMPDGETGERYHWVVHIVDGLRNHADLEIKKDGDWSRYDQAPQLRVRRGHKLRGETLDFGHVKAFDDSWPIFEELRRQADRPDLTFQQGVPGDLDMAFFVLGRTGPFLHRRPFTEATVREISEVHRRAGGDVVFQIEVPVEQVFVAKMPAPLQPAMAAFMARGVANLARLSPPGARFGLHLCVGDLNHEALMRMQDARPVVLLANAVAKRWPEGRMLEYVHAPFAAAAVPPPTEDRWYAPLGQLRLPASVRLIAGFAHEDQHFEDQCRLRDLIERLVGRTVDVSNSCGLGRRTPEAAQAALVRIAELVSKE